MSETCSESRAVHNGRVSFIGAGPGAADLITVRGARRIAEADVVVWAASLVSPECVHEHAREDAELIDSSRITLEETLAIYRRTAREKLRVARVHSGDPALWGAVQEQYDACVRLGLEVEIVPGVSAFSAAAAAIGRELTVPEVAQSIVLTRLEGGKTPMPEGERIREFARHGTTMAVFLSAARTGQLAEELRAGGYPEDTPVVVAYKTSWPDELTLYTTLAELEVTVKQNKLWRHTLFLIGRALGAAGTRSRLYNAGHFHTYRKADPTARRALRSKSPAGSSGSADDAASGDDKPAPAPGRRSKRWSAAATRTGQIATRLPLDFISEASPVDGISQVPQSQPTKDQPRRPGSDVAWSAVHEWQEAARATGRTRTRSRTSSSVPAQPAASGSPNTPSAAEEPGQPKLDAAPAERVGATITADQVEPASQVEPTEQTEPAKPIEEAKPTEQTESAKPSALAEPATRNGEPEAAQADDEGSVGGTRRSGGSKASRGRRARRRG